MCGICGISGAGNLDIVKKMADTLSHRGPDAEGFSSCESQRVYLGHKRLRVVDIGGGAQPMFTADKKVGIVFNGEIYNAGEIRAELEKRGYRFISDHSDTEVLLHGYREWGSSLVNHLNGMWAFCIHDVDKQELFLSRDRFGKKPLYYLATGSVFAFASELTALVTSGYCSRELERTSLLKYFAYGYIPAPGTLYRQVKKLPAGHSLFVSCETGKVRCEKYWEFILEPVPLVPKNAEQVWGEELRSLIHASVKRRLLADVPVGVFLSGGIDSSAIAFFASQGNGEHPVNTFSIGFHEKTFDETSWIQRAVKHVSSNHHHRMFSLDTARPILEAIAAKLDEPFGDSSLLPTYLLCQEAKKHVTVALGGDGADELFAGYDPFRALRFAEWYSRVVPAAMHPAVAAVAARLPVSHVNMSLDFRIKRTLRGLAYPRQLWNSIWLGPLDPKELHGLFTGAIDTDEVYADAIDCWNACEQKDLVSKTLQFYTRMYLQNDILTKIDRASMMHSLEVRSPFLDIDFVNFIRKVPASFKYRKGTTKYLLKKALEPSIPKEILYRKKKGFGIPVGAWFKNNDLSIRKERNNQFVDNAFINAQLGLHQAGRHDCRSFLWNIWLLDYFTDKT